MTDRPNSPCSAYHDESLMGTAATEQQWLAIEHRNAWGRDIFDGHAFNEELSSRLKKATHGYRTLLIRRPGRAGQHRSTTRIYIADSRIDGGPLRTLDVDSTSDLLDIGLDAGVPDAHATEPIALVCAHGKRDVCCARLGRPLAAAVESCFADEAVWECSHTGGHRFAPVQIILPFGYTYGRMSGVDAVAALKAARGQRVAVAGLRGRSSLKAQSQAAEVAVRQLLAQRDEFPRVNDLHVDGTTVTDFGTPSTPRTFEVTVHRERLTPRPTSCGKKPDSAYRWTAHVEPR